VAHSLIRAGRRFHSIALEADGRHLMTDVWTSIGVFAGVALVFATGLYWLDPLIAFAVAVHIVWTGVTLVRRSVHGLLDAAISPGDKSEVTQLFQEYSKRYGVAFHALRTRQAGARRFVSFHMLVPDAWTVAQAHGLCEELEERIRSLVPNASVDTHIEPISDPASYDDEELDRR
jgi:cation diffusion facilitator family transporter